MVYHIFALLIIICATGLNCHAAGGIVTDGSVGGINALHHPQLLSGNIVSIPESLGIRQGGNLFHSFKDFNIQDQQAVTFQEDKPMSTDNVITRVTGTSGSAIDGALNVTPAGKANFYLINPNGVVFGPNAAINVPGAFHVSTADQLRFKDGSVVNASLNNTSTLTAAEPAAFGFLGTSTANNGLIQVNAYNLNQSNKKGQTLDLVAGNITLDQVGGKLLAPDGGVIRIVAKTNKGIVSVEKGQFGNLPLPKETPTSQNAGIVSITGSLEKDKSGYAKLFVLDPSKSGDTGGLIALWGGAATITYAKLRSDIVGIVNKQTPQNNLEIHANTLKITDSALSSDIDIQESTTPGNVFVQTTGDMSILNNAQITADTYGNAKAGLVKVNVGGNLHLYGQIKDALNGIFANSRGAGDGGKVIVEVGKHLDILNGAQISSDSRSGLGRAGDVKVTADGGITIDAVSLDPSPTRGDCPNCLGPQHFTGISSDVVNPQGGVSVADAGTVDVSTKGNIVLRNAGWISSLNAGLGNGGNLKISFDKLLTLENNAAIRTDAHKLNNGGNISIKGNGSIYLKDSFIKSRANGSGGEINIKADNLVMETGLIEANALNGHGGQIKLDVQALIPSGNTANGQDITDGGFLQKGRSLVWDTGEFGNNIIRAFSQNGVDATIDLTAPQLNLSGTLANLGTPQFDTGFLSQEYCSLGAGSSLRRVGKGGLPLKGRDAWVY